MTSATLRKEVQQYINYADERFLRMVHSLAKEYAKNDDPVVGYNTGKSVKRSQLLDELKEAEQQIERGEYMTIDQLEKESETW
jgi:5'-3' exonuclease